ncbi:hypothetical protein [Enterovirga rhinocerotis]|uniref:DUF3592 domain-containing protein n=1 Tax=Enterovirga rhinocerotis TaxID=1339210 RepID=A0A4R7BW08_9HYPH|nr:hypothetical protein [Enterovirga rhinocerotis]TDR90050.1 hypothetical protein EV668_2888 [Enterovirga rhinocerotis]
MTRSLRRAVQALLASMVVLFLAAGPAQAYRFGTDETVHKIEGVKLKGAKDEALFLGHLTRIRWFLAGVYVEDAGYVLGVEGDSKRFYPMPEGEALTSFQRNGYLPDPLPSYEVPLMERVMGYSLWWGLALGIGAVLIGCMRDRRAAAEQARPSKPEPPPAPTS